MADGEHLLDVMDALAASMAEPTSLAEARQRIVESAVIAVPGVDYASITVLHTDSGLIETTAATDTLVRQLDETQYELQEGPCMDGVTEEELVLSKDLREDTRWPRYGRRASAAGIRAQIAIRLRNGPHVTGLNLYSTKVDGFTSPPDEARLVARHARVVLGYAGQLESLAGALDTRSDIGGAIGIIMERYKLDSDRAFQFLVRVSKNTNTKMRDLAKLVLAGEDLAAG